MKYKIGNKTLCKSEWATMFGVNETEFLEMIEIGEINAEYVINRESDAKFNSVIAINKLKTVIDNLGKQDKIFDCDDMVSNFYACFMELFRLSRKNSHIGFISESVADTFGDYKRWEKFDWSIQDDDDGKCIRIFGMNNRTSIVQVVSGSKNADEICMLEYFDGHWKINDDMTNPIALLNKHSRKYIFELQSKLNDGWSIDMVSKHG